MALKLDNTLLDELGLGALPESEKQLLLRQIYEKLEMNVGVRLADQMSNEQLDAFEKFVDANDDKGAFQWLESNFPNYKDVVNEEFEKLKAEIASVAPQILQSAAQNPQPVQAGQPQSGPQQMQPVQPQPQQYASQQPPAPNYGQPQPPAPQYQPQQPQQYQPAPQQQPQTQYQQPPAPQQYAQPAPQPQQYADPAAQQYVAPASPPPAPQQTQQPGHLQPQYNPSYGQPAAPQVPTMPLPSTDGQSQPPAYPPQPPTGPNQA